MTDGRERGVVEPWPYAGDDAGRIERLGTAHETRVHADDRSERHRYRYNRLGYRGADFDPTAEAHVFVFGESDAFGAAMDLEDSWPFRFVARWAASRGLDGDAVCVSNFAEGAASNAAIARLTVAQSARIRPDLVLVHFAHFARSEAHVHGVPVRLWPWIDDPAALAQWRSVPRGTRLRAMLDAWHAATVHWTKATSPETQVLESLRNMVLVQEFVTARGIPAIATCNHFARLRQIAAMHPATLGTLSARLRDDFVVARTLRDFATDDRRGADGQHESPATHEAFAAWMFERYESLRSEARPPPSPP